MTTPACQDCRFWVRKDQYVGLCRFNPPAQVYDVRNSIVAHWPESGVSDWCGRFVPTTNKPPMIAPVEEDF